MALEDSLRAAAARWPGVVVSADDVAREIAAQTAAAVEANAATVAVHTDDAIAELYLAIACARGDAVAIAAFDREFLAVVPQALASMKLPAATVDDVRAIVRDKLLVGDGARPPRVLGYAGHGRLRGLVQVMATRAALDRIRHEQREVELPARELAAPGDLATSLIKAQYREAFAAGFAAAIAGASRRDRNLLRLHFLGGVTLEALAQMYDVHRATIVRWLAAARGEVLAQTRAYIARTLGAPADELDEMFALVESRVELSLDRLLASVELSHR